MVNFKRRKTFHRAPPGSSPGTLSTRDDASETEFEVISYSDRELVEQLNPELDTIKNLLRVNPVTWVKIVGHKDVEKITKIADIFGVHSLSLEDMFHVHQRAKFESFEKYKFLVINDLIPGDLYAKKQTSFIIGSNFILSFHESRSSILDPVKERLRKSIGQLRQKGADYLAYALVDTYIDHFFPVAEAAHSLIDNLEAKLIADTTLGEVLVIHDLKVKLNRLYQIIWNHKEMFQHLTREAESPFSAEIRLYMRDCYDHTLQLLDYIEMLRTMVSGLLDLHITLQNTRANEVMKFLTVITTIFIPLSFVTGLYGMNFNTQNSRYNMPELNWEYGYPFVLCLMASIAFGLGWYFFKKKWITTLKVQTIERSEQSKLR